MKKILAFSMVFAMVMTGLSSCAPKVGEPAWIVEQVYLFEGGDFNEIRDYFAFGEEEVIDEEMAEEDVVLEEEDELSMIWTEVTRNYSVSDVKVTQEKDWQDGKKLLINLTFDDGATEEAEAIFFMIGSDWKLSVD